MKNVTVNATETGTIVVRADTERFGKNEILFEGSTFMQAFDYIRQKSGNNHFKLQGMPVLYGWFTKFLLIVLGKVRLIMTRMPI